MIAITLGVLTAVCVLLTVVFLGTLRGIVELRLQMSGRVGTSAASPELVAGRQLPVALLRVLPDPQQPALIAFVSDGCGACEQMAALLPAIPVTTIACVLGKDTGDIRQHLGSEVIVSDPADTQAAARALKLTTTPVVLLQHAGRVVGSAFGVSTQTVDELQRWWDHTQDLIKENAS